MNKTFKFDPSVAVKARKRKIHRSLLLFFVRAPSGCIWQVLVRSERRGEFLQSSWLAGLVRPPFFPFPLLFVLVFCIRKPGAVCVCTIFTLLSYYNGYTSNSILVANAKDLCCRDAAVGTFWLHKYQTRQHTYFLSDIWTLGQDA